MLDEAGIPSRLQRMEAFLRQNPDHGEAHLELLNILSLEAREADPISLQEIQNRWREAWEGASRARALVEAPEWTFSLAGNLLGEGVETLEPARRELEATLVRAPSGLPHWQKWLTLATLLGDSRLGSLVRELELSPLSDEPWPPKSLQAPLAQALRREGRWQDLVTLLEVPERRRLEAPEPTARGPKVLGLTWDDRASALLEAWLRLENLDQAQRFMEAWAKSPDANTAFRAAADLAAATGAQALALEWRRRTREE